MATGVQGWLASRLHGRSRYRWFLFGCQCLRESGNPLLSFRLQLGVPLASSIRVLVVEDEKPIQDILEAALKEGGFVVAIAASGEDAMRMLDAAEYRVLVVEVNLMPGQLTGWNVAKRARELYPDLPVVYITGASEHDWTSKGVPNSVLVPKPFAPAQVITAVSQLLNQGNTPST